MRGWKLEIDDIVDDGNADEETPFPGSKIASSAAMSFASREAQISGSVTKKFMQLIKEIIVCCEEFEITIAEMLSRLQTVEDEFMEMRSEEVVASVYVQASKAIECAVICSVIWT